MHLLEKIQENVEFRDFLIKATALGTITALTLGGIAAYKLCKHYKEKHKKESIQEQYNNKYILESRENDKP